jgi:hypothetical protein
LQKKVNDEEQTNARLRASKNEMTAELARLEDTVAALELLLDD